MTHPTPRAANVLGGGNTAPSLDPISNKYVVFGETLSFTAHGTDPDAGQVLTYALSGAPVGATIGIGNGVFNWAPSAAQTPSVNPMSVTVTDDGSPAMSASQNFTVYVSTRPSVGVTRNGNNLTLGFPTAPGRHYQVQYKNQLSDPAWTNLGPVQNGTGSTLQIPVTIGPEPQRFYQLIVVAQ